MRVDLLTPYCHIQLFLGSLSSRLNLIPCQLIPLQAAGDT